MVSVEQILEALKTTRDEFGRLYVQAQVRAGIGARERIDFNGIAESLPDKTAYEKALREAEQKGWLGEFVKLLVEENRQTGALTRVLAEAMAPGDAQLEAINNLAKGYGDPDVIYKGYGNGMQWTGKIIVDNVARGTGILIGPHLVLTAWHVVKDLFTKRPDGQWVESPSSAARLQVDFDDLLALIGQTLQPVAPMRVRAHAEWCVRFSACHPAELNDSLPNDYSELKDYWDYAVIRLAAPVGLTRRYAVPDGFTYVPKAEEGIFVFQHPQMNPLKVDQNTLGDLDPPDPSVVPKLRFLHYANTDKGSSGGPCFNKDFHLFGLHQGVWKGKGVGVRVTNRGIPILRVLEHIKAKGGLPALDPSDDPVWSLGETKYYEPVIGTVPFQKLVWRAAGTGTPRIVVIRGMQGSGKTFHTQLISSMLKDSTHLKLPLDAETISKFDARGLANYICETAGAKLPTLAEPEETDSTGSAWLRDEVLAKLITELDKAREGRLVWLLITQLDVFDIKQGDVSELLLLLYKQTASLNWLRVVLDGMKGDIPGPILTWTEQYNIPPATRDDVQRYFERLRAEKELVYQPAAMARATFSDYEEMFAQNPERAMSHLKGRIMKLVIAHLAND